LGGVPGTELGDQANLNPIPNSEFNSRYPCPTMPTIDVHALEDDLLLKGVWEGLGRPECHLTGGYVRDRLLGRESTDLDLVAAGSIDDWTGAARRLAARLDTSAHVLGSGVKRVWRLTTDHMTIELWPMGDLGLGEDIWRRDFSCNALVWQMPGGPMVDQVGAMDDLRTGTLRGLSRANLADDPVRVLRASRFLAQLDGFELEGATASWIRALAPRLRQAPPERVGQELVKLVRAKGAAAGLRSMLELDLLAHSAPVETTPDPRWLRDHLEAASCLAGAAPHPVQAAVATAGDAAALALVLRAWGTPVDDDLAGYAWPREVRKRAATAAELLPSMTRTAEAPAADRRLLIHRAGPSFPAALALAAAVEPQRPWRRWWRLWRERGRSLVDPHPLLDGHEIAAITGLASGPVLGSASRALLEATIRGEVRSRQGAIRWLRRSFSNRRPS
jgi:tRNA nucleotidyltransferase (CCA-adding enzyme)